MSDSDIIDPQAQARLREWGGAKLLTQMIRLFLENAPNRMEQVRKGLAEGNVREAERGVHSLKSSAANVGAVRVSRLAAQMEDHASRADLTAVAGQMPNLESEFAAASHQLAAILAATPEAEA
jgi:HPt (histidine-containing phosphotransfer) domain-containing protein